MTVADAAMSRYESQRDLRLLLAAAGRLGSPPFLRPVHEVVGLVEPQKELPHFVSFCPGAEKLPPLQLALDELGDIPQPQLPLFAAVVEAVPLAILVGRNHSAHPDLVGEFIVADIVKSLQAISQYDQRGVGLERDAMKPPRLVDR